ncbi:MAG: 4-hydroxy-tetrahydrodipicolinate reductase [Phycisphaeraceae bacterium]|nr:4-hydroxy-tetrahydrodipicolinate reductase [Phycisphaeraceae bacterium]
MSDSSTPVIVHGATGRMGARIIALSLLDPSVRIAGAADAPDSPRIGGESGAPGVMIKTAKNLGETGVSARVVVDFSSDDGARAAADLAVRIGAALLVGTTGLSESTRERLRVAAREVAVVVAPNTSLGVAVVSKLARDAARALGPAFECSIVEAHHSRKKDAPSGTALRLAAAVRSAGHALRDDQVVAIRGGDVIGEHTVRFAGPGEYIEITHRATTRDLFAIGAIHAAKWLDGKPAGMYSIEDALGMSA